METWLRELRSPPGEGAFRGASRQVGAGFKLLRRDRTILALALLGALALSGIWIGFFFLERETGPLGREADQVFRHLLYGAASVGVSSLLSLAVACAADARIDGGGGDARLLAAKVRRRLPALLGWWLISICAWVGLGLAADAVMRPFVAMLAVALVWGVATFFVVPTIAIEDCGTLDAIREGLRLLRDRWGRALVGFLTLGCFLFLTWVAAGFVMKAGTDRYPRHHQEGLWIYFGALTLGYLGYGVAVAAREGFALILARDALGDLPGEPAAAKPRRHGWVIARRIALGILGLVVLLGVLGAIFGHRKQSEPAGATGLRSERFVAHVENPNATLLVTDAPVVLEGKTIGRVFIVDVERPPPRLPRVAATFRANPRCAPILAQSRFELAMRDGRAYLVVVPAGEYSEFEKS